MVFTGKRGGKGLFTKELEQAILDGKADLAVHSAKDMPTENPDGLALSAFLKREDPRDVLVVRSGIRTIKKIASGSPRRISQLKARVQPAQWIELRGNVETRLRINRGRPRGRWHHSCRCWLTPFADSRI